MDGISMRLRSAKPVIALTLLALVVSGCASRGPAPVSSLGEDDDTYCRANNVAAGSSEYIACRKDRDTLRNNAAAKTDRRQRDLGEYMMDHPDHP
jgi:PBP1b-binding outer membrane lipoprotein LpoB